MTGDDPRRWARNTGLKADTTRVQVYCRQSEKQTWDDEAEQHGYSSTSKYLYELIQEARAYRQEGFLSHHQSEEEIEQLEAQVDALKQRVQQQEKQSAGEVMVGDPEFVKRFLTTNYQPLKEILRDIVESGALDGIVRKEVEDSLYYLAQQGRVTYERGWGWKLVEDGDV